MDIQIAVSQWVGQVAGYLHLGYGVGAGMVSAVNPCGFAMLPVYLTLYLGANESEFEKRSWLYRLIRAVGVTLVVTAGFSLLFLLVGSVILMGGNAIMAVVPWFAILIGVFLVALGIWLMLGKHLSFGFLLNLSTKIGDPSQMTIKGFFLFGLAFGMTSMSCTLPIFLAVVGSSINQGDFVQGMYQFLAFVSGMGLVMLTLTLSLAFIKGGVVLDTMRKIQPMVNKISAVFLLIAGGYIIYYWLTSGLF